MNADDYKFLQQLLRPFEGNAFDPSFIDNTQLNVAVGHPNEDIRTASLYLMNNLVEVNEGAVENILGQAVHDGNAFSVRTAAQFLAHCNPQRANRFFLLRVAILGRRREIMDEETQQLIDLMEQEDRVLFDSLEKEGRTPLTERDDLTERGNA